MPETSTLIATQPGNDLLLLSLLTSCARKFPVYSSTRFRGRVRDGGGAVAYWFAILYISDRVKKPHSIADR